ncbi:diadenosine tetraphosphate (Ap4A) HIT family hydrolase [Peribacillus deserti]|uniref:Diadenosine tetraphosphate (Ap4A) HIT family hydrolase n=1 Tax=Peribacillus deserti TaxID=673318 RepID=A0ABS2QL82_9BACI|nr:diadenosine tetraphosphate (Ap4A) HIT family hydrolase [Peribacillus deserti]
MEANCLGCRLALQMEKVHVIYEDNYVSCILDHNPFNEGYALIIPKAHFLEVEDFDQDTAAAVMNASRLISRAIRTAYSPDGITICQNGGIFSELSHYHMHIVPRY